MSCHGVSRGGSIRDASRGPVWRWRPGLTSSLRARAPDMRRDLGMASGSGDRGGKVCLPRAERVVERALSRREPPRASAAGNVPCHRWLMGT